MGSNRNRIWVRSTHKRIYRAILISILLILMIPLSFLIFMGSVAVHKYYAITPYDFPGSIWESQEPFIHLEVSEDIGDGINGTIQINGETKEVVMELKTEIGSFAEIYDKNLITQKLEQNNVFFDEYIHLNAYCKYSENTIVMKIKEDNIYDGKYKRIVLDRVEWLEFGRVISQNSLDVLTDYVYDSDNRVTAVTQGKVKSEYTYNEFNSIKKIKSKMDWYGKVLVGNAR